MLSQTHGELIALNLSLQKRSISQQPENKQWRAHKFVHWSPHAKKKTQPNYFDTNRWAVWTPNPRTPKAAIALFPALLSTPKAEAARSNFMLLLYTAMTTKAREDNADVHLLSTSVSRLRFIAHLVCPGAASTLRRGHWGVIMDKVSREVNQWVNECMTAWMHEWMNEWMNSEQIWSFCAIGCLSSLKAEATQSIVLFWDS